jgi:FHA domain
VLSKLFKWKKKPQKVGEIRPISVRQQNYVKRYELELSNMEGTPTYALSHQLSVGSEIGNIVIADESISPRHATFLLQDEVISIIDHASINGTMINGKKIDSGKYIILEDTDTILLGDLEIRINVSSEVAAEDFIPAAPQDLIIDNVPEFESPSPIEELPEPESELDVQIRSVPVPEKASKLPKTKTKKKKKTLALTSTSSTNALVRVCAVLGDILVAYIIYAIFLPFDEFREFINFIPDMIADLLDIQWSALFEVVRADLNIPQDLINDLATIAPELQKLKFIFILFVLIRLTTTLLLGCSLSEAILGVRSSGNGIWARVGGVLRVIVGVFTGPFLIFDLPSLISKRTLKEFLTFTDTYLSSKLYAFLGFLFYFPLLLAMIVLSPLIIGLDVPEPIAVDDRIEKRVKVAKVEGAAEEEPLIYSSEFMGVRVPVKMSEVSVIPDFKFIDDGKSFSFQGQTIFYYPELQRAAQLRLYKKFSMKELVSQAIYGNYFLSEKYPELSAYVHQSPEAQRIFIKNMNEKSHDAFSNEFISLTKASLGLSLDNFPEVLEKETFQLKGLVDFKAALLSLLEYKNFDRIGLAKIGSTLCLKVSYPAQKPFDLIIPLVKGEGRVYKVDFDKKTELSALTTKFYKYTLDKVSFFPDKNEAIGDTLNPLQVIDVLSKFNPKAPLNMSHAQALYGYYFEKSAQVLTRNDAIEMTLWKSSVEDTMKIIQKMSAKSSDPTEEKLRQNFQDLKQALDNGSRDYFGIQNPTI